MTSGDDDELGEPGDWLRSPDSWHSRRVSDPLLRHWVMLRMIPRHPKKIDPPTLRSLLAKEGYSVDLRSVQRDLHKLSSVFPLLKDDHRPAGWSWQTSAPPFDVPGMDPHTAIAFRLVEQQLQHQLPRTTLDALKPHFKLAKGVLGGLRREGLPAWNDKVRATPRGQLLLAPKVAPSVLTAVYDALLEEKRLQIRYRNRADKTSTGPINPLGLVFRDALPVLVCTWFDLDEDIRTLPLQRIEKASILDEKRRTPLDFDLGAYVESGEASFRLSPKPIKLVARFDPSAARSVVETPLSAEQKVVTEKGGWIRVEAVVEDTRVLRGWLLSFGPLVEVVKPVAVRRDVAEATRAAAKRYGA